MEEEVTRKKRKIRELKKQILQKQQIAILSPLPPPATSFSTKISTMTKKSIIPEKQFSHLSMGSKRNQKNKNTTILDNIKIPSYWDNILRKMLNMHDYLTRYSNYKLTKKLNIGNDEKI